MFKVRTTVKTRWHDPEKGFFVLDAGEEGHALSSHMVERLPAYIYFPIVAAKKRYAKRGLEGVFFYCRGKYRFLQEGSYEIFASEQSLG